MKLKTADLADAHPQAVQAAQTIFRDFGAVRDFHGSIATLKVLHDYLPLRNRLQTPGEGRVLVVDGGGSLERALLGDNLAGLALANHWAGLVIFGAVRDSQELAQIPLGLKALGTCPLRSNDNRGGQSDIPLHFAGVDFIPGHYLYADADGILVTPKPLH